MKKGQLAQMEAMVVISGIISLALLALAPWVSMKWVSSVTGEAIPQKVLVLAVFLSWAAHAAAIFWRIGPKGIRLGGGMEKDLLLSVLPMMLVQLTVLLVSKISPRTALLSALCSGVLGTVWQFVLLTLFIVVMAVLNA